MQRLRQSLFSFVTIGYEAAAAARVGSTSVQQASLPLSLSRQHSTAVAEKLRGLDRSDPNYLQQLKSMLRPQNSNRNRFHRMWQKQLQIKWNAQERKANEAAARQARDAKRKELWAKRREFKAAAAEAAGSS